MKRFLNKTLTVKQVAALFIIPLGIIGAMLSFSTNGTPPVKQKENKIIQKKDSTGKIVLVDTSSLGRLKSFLDTMNNDPHMRGGGWSFYLADVDSEKPICAIDIDRGLLPASVMKIVTTGTALSILGPGFRFSTTLQYDGTIDAGTKTLNGNIYIHGGGDPTLGSPTFGGSVEKVVNGWALAIKRLGIDSIAGCVIGDAESYDRDPVPGGWTWNDMQSDYGTGPCGLNINENIFTMQISPSGGGTSIRMSPFIPGLKLYNNVIVNSSIGKSYAYVIGAPFQFDRTAVGEISAYHEERAAIPDPALFCAQTLRSSLKEYGIGIRDSATTLRLMRLNHLKSDATEGRKVITSCSSASLADLVFHTNQVSQNFYAESILRAIAWKVNGYGSTTSAVNIVYNFWRQRNVDLRGICMIDGCGLSRMDAITTHQLVQMLRTYAKDTAMFPSFYKSLPVAGESGTIRKLADGTEADGNLHAKSGTMSRVKSYAGYVKTRSGKMLCFAMIGNNTLWSEDELRDKFERLFILMAQLE
ncbi:MAG: D-alanyl-D-alanine carboxypeptidase/D-alanyl-D-alanine-endopeptidase [Bacteroidetes bacterium]|nr:D-alanyl-D-alanine carboxypeptidase/D-alanyl-D-alanine-endopeptidase [Bacteroidota bacterium]